MWDLVGSKKQNKQINKNKMKTDLELFSRFDSWSGKIPHARGNQVHVPQLLSALTTTAENVCLEPMLHNKRSHHDEKPVNSNKESS